MHYIYKITNLVNQKVYIGQTKNPKKRWYHHRTTANRKPKYVINLAMKKHGLDNFIFDVIASCLDQNAANIAEDICINQENSMITGHGYNVKPGGNTCSGWHHTEETKRKIRETPNSGQFFVGWAPEQPKCANETCDSKARNFYNELKYCLKHYKRLKKGYYLPQKGRKASEETRMKMLVNSKLRKRDILGKLVKD